MRKKEEIPTILTLYLVLILLSDSLKSRYRQSETFKPLFFISTKLQNERVFGDQV